MAILWVRSESKGIFTFSRPPSFLGVLIQAKWVKCESTDAATTSVLSFLNSSILSENAIISVGQTNVLKKKKKNLLTNLFYYNIWLIFKYIKNFIK